MGAGSGYFGEASEVSPLPTPVKTVRVLLFVVAGFTLLLIVGALLAFGYTAELLGALAWDSWPGVVGFIVALKIKKPSRVKFWLIIVVAAFDILNALSWLGEGDPRGFTTMILPILILVFVLRRSSRQYFHRSRED